MDNKNLEPIAVIGMGAIMPGANDKETFWQNILDKKNCISEVPSTHWDINVFYDPDHKAKDKTYSKIGGFIRDFKFNPIKHRIPPQIALQMDSVQHLAIETAVMAMADAGYDKKPFDRERVGVIIGNSMGGMKKEQTDLRVYRQTYFDMIRKSSAYAGMGSAGNALLTELEAEADRRWAPITEDTMPGELSNVIAGRVANILNVNAANFTVDAACATSLAAVFSAVNGLRLGHFDMCICGGVDQMMSASAYIKFCKIGALSEDGSWVFDQRANGFVMAEGAGMVLLKRLSDAVRDGDRIYSLIRAIGASSDGKGKGITAPNPKGQCIAIAKTFEQLDYTPAAVGLMEAHGTATRVGDVTEVNSTGEFFSRYMDKKGSIAMSSVKSMMGHAKAAAGIASLIKTSFALHNKVLPPSMNFNTPNPDIDWKNSPFRVVTSPEEWSSKVTRRANVSSFGFGGTNFHAALEEFDPKATRTPEPRYMKEDMPRPSAANSAAALKVGPEKLQSETLTFSAIGKAELINEVRLFAQTFSASDPYPLILEAYKRYVAPRGSYGVAIVAENPGKLKDKIAFFIKTATAEDVWEKSSLHLKMKSIYPFRPQTYGGKVGFMFPGQGSQYVDMMKDLASKYQVVQDTFDEADRILKGLIDTTLTEVIWSKPGENAEQLAKREDAIKQTQMTQPAVLTADIAMFRLLGTYGLRPDVSMGHSLGEYAAAVAAGVFTFENGLRAVTNRAKEMSSIKVEDPGKMASIAAPCERVEPELKKIKGYVVAANKNCPSQTVIAGEKQSIEEAIKLFTALGIQAVEIPVSHAFHSEIIRDAVEPYRRFLTTLPIDSPKLPLLSNVTADYFPSDPDAVRTLLVKQITSTVEWIRQLERMYADGVRIFVECGPKRVLSAFATSTLANKKDIFILSSNHPKKGGIVEFNDLLANMTASSIKLQWGGKDPLAQPNDYNPAFQAWINGFTGNTAPAQAASAAATAHPQGDCERFGFNTNDIVISGIAAGVPGSWDSTFRESGIDEILSGKNLIEPISPENQQKQIDKNVVYVVKSATGDHRIERLTSISQAIKLAARKGSFDLEREFGLPANWVESMDTSMRLAIAAGVKALHDAGIPLVQSYKKTSTGRYLPEKWTLPADMADETGVIFASAFPTTDNLAREISRSLTAKFRNSSRADIYKVYEEIIQKITDPTLRRELSEWFAANFNKYHAKGEVEQFSQNFLLKIIPIGHSQFCQWIRARGPATHVSAACSTTTQAVGIAEDWIRTGRAKRVIVIGGDDITNENAHEWVMAGFLASGAATTTEQVSEAALPFDRRRHGMIVGMGAIGIVVEDETCTRARGMKPLARLLGTVIANSAFHPTRLDVTHVADVMDSFIGRMERRHGLNRSEISKNLLFMSHETYTPARGGSASAEVHALRKTFGRDVMNVVVSNVKGFTGHTMGASLEDVVAVRALNTGKVPPIANYKEADPELAGINLSKGGQYDLRYALRLGAGFGSQLAMSLTERTYKTGEARIENPTAYQNWLKEISGQKAPELEVIHNTLRVKDIFDPASDAAPPVVMEAPQAFVATEKPMAAAIPAARTPAQQPASYTAAKPVPAPVVPKPAQHDEESIKTTIVELVTQKTGYPKDMLEIDLDMEADLGIDTVKQAELFAGIRDHYNIPRRDGVKLKDYPTIRHCIKFVIAELDNLGMPAAAPKAQPTAAAHKIEAPAQAAPAPTAAPKAMATGTKLNEESVKAAILEMVTQKTGYPKDMLDIDLDMEADLGIDTVKQAELFAAMRDSYNIPRKDGVKLKDYPTIRHCINFVMTEAATASAAPAVEAPVLQPAPVAQKVETPKQAPAPAPKAEAPKAAPAAKASALNEESVKTAILDMISAKTGYPKDMLEIDLDMEADLGIDTVKQAELFAAMRDSYNIPRKDGVKLKDYPTIRHCINFVMTEAGTASAAPAVEAPVAQPAPVAQKAEAPKPAPAPAPKTETPKTAPTAKASALNEESVKAAILDMISAKTGYPKDMLEIDLDMEADLGIDTVKQAELFATMRDSYNIPRKDGVKLKDYPTIRHCINFVMTEAGTASAAPAAEAPVAQPAPVAQKAEAPKPAPAPAPKTETPKTAPTAKASALNEESVKAAILDMISAKTGYPKDMLEIDLDMEADLGIDTVKQAELFATMRDSYNIPRKDGVKLKDYPTIRHCINFVMTEAGTASAAPTAAEAPAPTAAAEEQPVATAAHAPEFKRVETRNLRHVPLVVDAPLTAKEDRKLSHERPVIIFSDNAAMARAFQGELSSLKVKSHIFTSLKTRSKNATVVNWKDLNDVEAALKEYALGNPNVQGFIYLLGCTDKKLDRKASAHDDLVRYVMPLFVACKVFEKDLANRADADTFINVCMTHDGGFGYYGDKQADPVYGALAGTMRCLRKDMYELTKCVSKLQDFEPAEGPEYISQTAMDELLHGDSILDIAWGGRKRQTYHALPEKLDTSKEHYDLRGKTVLVTGGGRGLGAMFAKATAERYRSNFVIFDIIPVTAKTAEYAAMSADELKAVKSHLWEAMKADTTRKATPVMLEREFTRIVDSITLYRNLEALKQLGSKVDYHVCDVTDRKAMAETLASIKSAKGRIDGVVHFAGLERSKLVNEKTIEEFFKIYDVKAQSAMDLLAADIVKDSGFWLFISSIAGKFGNLGQSDYAAASDYNSKLAISLHNGGTRAIAIDMSAYAAVGMGARPGVEAFLKSQGLDFIQPDEGIQALVDEIVYGEVPEYVLTSTLDKLDWDKQVTIDHNPAPGKVKGNRKGDAEIGGENVGGNAAPSAEQGPARPFVAQMTAMGKAMQAEKIFSLESDYYLKDHAISGTPYVPGVMGIETFMEAAAAASGKAPAGLEEVRFMLPIKLLRNKPQKVKIIAEKTGSDGKLDLTIESDFLNPQGIKLGNPRKHFAAHTLESADSKWTTVVKPNLDALPASPVATSEQIYKVYFHGPSFQVLESVLAIDDQRVLAVYKRPAVYQWKDGVTRDLLAYPMLIEAAFQACGYRDLHRDNVMALPDNVGKVLVYNHGEAPEKLFILGIFKGKDEMGKSIYDAFVFDQGNRLWIELEDYRMIPQ